MSRVYIAAPLFNEAERNFNEALASVLRPFVGVYLPQADGILLHEAVASGDKPEAAAQRVFQEDIRALRDCSALVIVLNGRTVDEGAAFELGVSWSLGKQCVAYKSDPRQLLAVGDNPMIMQAVSRVLHSLSEVEAWARNLVLCKPG